ncbi:hypothetical protein ACFFK0_24690 [Paenibacillus chartarius]|uniref:Uncharacterized protein n=1 Tax=Paenibacillus chartarius TaxID=747481 RepID=A0ABV6DSQ9_9BACL
MKAVFFVMEKRIQGLWRGAIFGYLLLWFLGSFWAIAALRSGSLSGVVLGIHTDLLRDYLYYGLAGAIGGSLYGLRTFHQFYYDLTMRFVYWYTMRPLLCFGCAIMTVLLFQSGILLLQLGDSPLARISVAFLSGFGYGKFIEKIKALTETLFSGEQTGSGSDGSRNGGGPPGGGTGGGADGAGGAGGGGAGGAGAGGGGG